MKSNKLLSTLAIVSVATAILIASCKKDNTTPGNPIVIPVQTIVMSAVSLAGSANFAVLAGSAITNTGATNITGDLGLSPGTSIVGFPPGIFTGIQLINDVVSNQAKLD